MARDMLGADAAQAVERIVGGVGVVRERTIEIGARVLWVDNIGSLVILRGSPNYTLYFLGGIALLFGMISLSNDVGVGLMAIVIGIILIALNAMQKVDNGLSIGTVDGRSTLIVSTDEQFLFDTLDLLQRKIDSGSITLQGTFDIGDKYVRSSGGGIVVGDAGVARGVGSQPPRPQGPAPSPQVTAAPNERPRVAEQRSDPPPHIERAHEPYDSTGAPPRRNVRALVTVLIAGAVAASAGWAGYAWWQAEQRRQAADAVQAAWEAVPKDNARALRAFLAGDPGIYRADAEELLTTLERNSYAYAQREDTIYAYQRFLDEFPASSNAIRARNRIDQLHERDRFAALSPILLAPLHGTVFNVFPRLTNLQWSPMEDAASYIVEVQMFDPIQKVWVEDSPMLFTTSTPGHEINFVGAQPGRWRVRAVDDNGNESAWSPWWEFTYQR